MLVLVFELGLLVTGNMYVNNVLKLTVFKGRLGPAIDDYKYFPYRKIEPAIVPFEWNYETTKTTLSKEQTAYLEKYQTTAFLVIKNNKIVFENYWDNFTDSTLSNSFSMAKTVVGILIGVAINEGKVESVNDPIYKYLPEYNTDKGKRITIKHLLTMSSGINFNEDYINPFSFPAHAYYGDDILEAMSGYEPSVEPGIIWRYRGGDTQLLAFILENATGKTISEYAEEKLWKPIGATYPAYWSIDSEGGKEKASCCLNSNAKDFAKIGKLYLDTGNWQGNQIVPKNYVLESITPCNLVDSEGEVVSHYGYQWWLLNYKNKDLFYARGILGQYIIVVPEDKLIIVRLGHDRHKEKGQITPQGIYHFLDIAFDIS